MRTRVQGRIDIESVVRQIECEIKSYSRAVKIIMELYDVNYNEAKGKLNRRLLFKNL